MLVIVLAMIWLMPLYWLVRSSFMGIEDMFKNPPIWIPKKLRFENYRSALTALPFVKYFFNTITIVVLSVLGILISCFVSAYGLSRVKWKYRDVVFTVLMSTMILPYFTTLIPNFIFWKKLGLVNTFYPMIVPTWFCMGIASVYGGGMFNISCCASLSARFPGSWTRPPTWTEGGIWRYLPGLSCPYPSRP